MTPLQTRHLTAQLLCILLPLSLVVAIEMKKVVPHKKASLTERVLRLLGMSRSLEEPSTYQEITPVPIPTDNYYGSPKEFKTALLEAERRKAEAIMELEKRRFIC